NNGTTARPAKRGKTRPPSRATRAAPTNPTFSCVAPVSRSSVHDGPRLPDVDVVGSRPVGIEVERDADRSLFRACVARAGIACVARVAAAVGAGVDGRWQRSLEGGSPTGIGLLHLLRRIVVLSVPVRVDV